MQKAAIVAAALWCVACGGGAEFSAAMDDGAGSAGGAGGAEARAPDAGRGGDVNEGGAPSGAAGAAASSAADAGTTGDAGSDATADARPVDAADVRVFCSLPDDCAELCDGLAPECVTYTAGTNPARICACRPSACEWVSGEPCPAGLTCTEYTSGALCVAPGWGAEGAECNSRDRCAVGLNCDVRVTSGATCKRPCETAGNCDVGERCDLFDGQRGYCE